MINIIALAIPVFFAGVFVEARIARSKGLPLYRLGDALGDMGCGIAQQLGQLVLAGVMLGGYGWIYERFRLVTPPVWLGWVLAFLGVDFVYYWWHRLSHEVNLLWAAHVVHHQSEDYNLAVALRQSVTTSLFFFPFLAVLALVGVTATQLAVINAFSLLYQFWIHTELIGKLGPFEKWFNTPSLHRVHHAINAKYLDRNHGGTLIVWDRLFGTWQPEEEQCVYGTTKPFGSYNPIWAQVDGYWNLIKLARAAPSPLEAVKVFYKSPAWRAPWFPDAPLPALERREQQHKYDPRAPKPRWIWALVNFVLAVAGLVTMLALGTRLPLSSTAVGIALVALALINVSALLENKPWAGKFEAFRWAVTTGGVAWLALTGLR